MDNQITKTFEESLEEVLDEIRPSLRMHGGDAQIKKVEAGVVHLRLQGGCRGCPMAVVTFGVALKEMFLEKFPEKVKDVVWQDAEEEDDACCVSQEKSDYAQN